MFSEYYDNKEPIDKEEKQETREENNWLEWQKEWEENPNKEEKETAKVQSLQAHISSKMVEYRWFFDGFPNALHEDTSWWSMWKGAYEAMASEIWGITEKKIKWFDKNLWNGKNVEVRENWWQIHVKIKEGNEKEVSLSLNNFESINNTWKSWENKIKPTISINWDGELLNDFLWEKVENLNSWESINTLLTMDDNADLFEKVFDNIHEKIISKEIQDLDGYVDRAKNMIDSANFPEYLLEQDNRNNIEWDSNSFVEYLITNIEGKALDIQDLVACKVLLSLCILLRNSSNNIETIKEVLWFVEDENLWKEKTIQWGENLIEFLPINEKDLKKFMTCRDEVINLGRQELENEETKNLSSNNTDNPDNDVKLREINKLLDCLNK